jgi:hypothetical protein
MTCHTNTILYFFYLRCSNLNNIYQHFIHCASYKATVYWVLTCVDSNASLCHMWGAGQTVLLQYPAVNGLYSKMCLCQPSWKQLTPALDGLEWSPSLPSFCTPGKEPSLSFEQEVWWAPQLVWTVWTVLRCTAHCLVTIWIIMTSSHNK